MGNSILKATSSMDRQVSSSGNWSQIKWIWFAWVRVRSAILVAGCGSATVQAPPKTPPPAAGITVSVTPPSANLRAGDALTFQASVSGTTNAAVTWSVNGTKGGTTAIGAIGTNGKYTAPVSLPNPNTVTVKATSAADATANGTSSVTLMNPTPVIMGINPTSISTGNFSLTVTGSKFVTGTTVLLNGSAISTTVNSSTQLTATGNAASAGTYAVSVQNPDPGSSTSSSLNLTVSGPTQALGCSGMSLGQGASLNGFRPFPADNFVEQRYFCVASGRELERDY